MPQKSDHYVHVGTLVSMHIADIWTKTAVFFCRGRSSMLEYNKRHIMAGIKFTEQAKMIIVVDKWLHSLNKAVNFAKVLWKACSLFLRSNPIQLLSCHTRPSTLNCSHNLKLFGNWKKVRLIISPIENMRKYHICQNSENYIIS